jgi:hypothetical protein
MAGHQAFVVIELVRAIDPRTNFVIHRQYFLQLGARGERRMFGVRRGSAFRLGGLA